MVSSCSAVGCHERAKKGTHITFHRFPARPELREKWLKAIKRKGFQPTKNSRICEKHFTRNSYIQFHSGRKVLKENAIPQIFDFSSFISETNQYKSGKSELTPISDSSPNTSGAINCIEFVDVNALESHSIPTGSQRMVIVMDSENSVNCPSASLLGENVEENDHEDSFVTSKNFNTEKVDPCTSTMIVPGSENSSRNQSCGSTTFNSCVSNTSCSNEPNSNHNQSNGNSVLKSSITNSSFYPLYSPHDLRRQQMLKKASQMKKKYLERLKIMNNVNKQLTKRKAFLEDLMIRIKEKQLTCNDDMVDLLDCFIEEESLESDEDSYDDEEVQNQIINLIDEIISKTSNLDGRQPEFEECEVFGAYVESMLKIMPQENVTTVQNQINELINIHHGKRLINFSKKFKEDFSGLENIEIDDDER